MAKSARSCAVSRRRNGRAYATKNAMAATFAQGEPNKYPGARPASPAGDIAAPPARGRHSESSGERVETRPTSSPF